LEWIERTLPPCDVAVISRPDIRAAVHSELARPLSSTTGRATVQDIQLERRPRGFALQDIAMPVHVWHGRLDCNVLLANGLHQAKEIHGAILHEIPDAGHWLHYDHFDEILIGVTASSGSN
jgi:pimeloyl-ACP methyl ester carboxylesterase